MIDWRAILARILAAVRRGENKPAPVESRQVAPPRVWAVGGDSLGVGMAAAGKIPNSAVTGAMTYAAAPRLSALPIGATVIFSCGTNDAAGGLPNFESAVDEVLRIAANRKQTIVWVGPLSNKLPWAKYAVKADEILRRKVPLYVSLFDVEWTAGERAPDQYHLTPRGYARALALAKAKVQ